MHRLGEGERQRVAEIGRREAALLHVVLPLELDRVSRVVAVFDARRDRPDNVGLVDRVAQEDVVVVADRGDASEEQLGVAAD